MLADGNCYFLAKGERHKLAEMPSNTVSPKIDTGAKLLKARVPKEINVVSVDKITANAVEFKSSPASLKKSE